MTARQVLDRVDELGVELELVGDRIRYRSRGGALASDLLAQLRRYRAELVPMLMRRARLAWPPAHASGGDEERTGPLTVSQQTLWATNHLADDGTYNLCGALRLRGPLAGDAFAAALDDLQHRHPSLRTVFTVGHGEPMQRVRPRVPVPLTHRDLRGQPPEAAFDACLRECSDLVDRRLPLEDDVPPVRMYLYRLADEDHVFFVVLHHVLADGVSFQILIEDLVRCCNARRAGEAPPPRPHTFDMVDYARWERDYLRYGNRAAVRRYWRDALVGCPAGPLPLPAPVPGAASGRGAAHRVEVDAEVTAAVRALATSTRSSPFLVVAAAVASMLARLTGRDDLVVGMPVARRDQDGLHELVGLLLDTVPVRLDLRGRPSFREVIRRARAAVLGALTHPFPPQSVDERAPGSDRAGRTLFNVLVTDAGGTLPAPRFHGVAASEVEVPQIGAKFDLNVLIRDAGDNIRIDVEFDRRAVSQAGVAAMASAAVDILARAVADPSRGADELALAADRLATIAPAPGASPAADDRVVALLRDLVREVLYADGAPEPDATDRVDASADFFDLGGDSMRAIKLVGLAQERGLVLSLRDVYDAPVLGDLAARAVFEDATVDTPAADVDGRTVAATTHPPFSLLPADAARSFPSDVEDTYPMTALQVGMIYHQELAPASRVYHNLLSVRVGGRMEPEAFRAAAQAVTARHPVLRTSVDLGHAAGPVQRVHTDVEVPVRFEDLTDLAPDDQVRRIEWVLQDERKTDFDLATPPLLRFVVLTLSAHVYQLVFSHHHILLDGWSVNILFDDLHSCYRALLDGDRDPSLPPLRGGPVDYVALEQAALADPAEEAFWLGHAAPGAPLLAPGAAGELAMRRMSVDFPAGTLTDLRRVAGAVGTPLKALLLAAHVRVLAWLVGHDDIVTGLVLTCRPDGPDADRLLGLFLNELPMVARLGDPTWAELARQVHEEELTMLEHRWYPHAAVRKRRGTGPLFDSYFNFTDFHTTKRLVQDEDLDLVDALELEFTHYALGVNFTVDLRSHELRLILEYDSARLERSTVLLAAEASRVVVRAIAAHPDAPCRRVSLPGVLELARLRERDDGTLRPDLEESVNGRLPAGPAVSDPPPPTPEPRTGPGTEARTGAGTEARTALEQSVREIWAAVLGSGDHRLDQSFFDVGGDSLTAMQVVSRLRAKHGAFTMRAFAADPTIAATAWVLAGDRAAPRPPGEVPPVAAQPGDYPRRYPVSATQHQLWSLATRLPQLPLFGIPGAFRIEGPVDLDLLEEAFATVVARHEALRTQFVATQPGVEQVVEPHVALTVERVDLSQHPDPLAESDARTAVAAREPFALDRAPLMRVIAYRISEHTHVVHLNVHHIVCDGWSMALLQRETTQIYRELAVGALAERPVPLGSGQLTQARLAWAGAPAADPQRRYWLERLAPPWPALSDPAGSRFSPSRPASLPDRFRSRSCRRVLPSSTVQALRIARGATGLTEFMLVLAGYAATLAAWSGQPDIRVATMLANRGEPGAEDVVGLLANTAVLRLRMDPSLEPVAVTQHVRHVCLEAYDHQELPFEDVLESLERTYPERERPGPLFEAMLLMQEELTGVEVGDDLRLTPHRPEHAILTTTVAPTTMDLILAATTGPSGTELNLQYKPAAMTDAAARELVDDVVARLTDIAQALRERG